MCNGHLGSFFPKWISNRLRLFKRLPAPPPHLTLLASSKETRWLYMRVPFYVSILGPTQLCANYCSCILNLSILQYQFSSFVTFPRYCHGHLSTSTKTMSWDFDWECTESVVQYAQNWHQYWALQSMKIRYLSLI